MKINLLLAIGNVYTLHGSNEQQNETLPARVHFELHLCEDRPVKPAHTNIFKGALCFVSLRISRWRSVLS